MCIICKEMRHCHVYFTSGPHVTLTLTACPTRSFAVVHTKYKAAVLIARNYLEE